MSGDAAAVAAAPMRRVLVCRTGSRLCALALADVVETMRPLPIEALRGMPELVLGVSIVRGRLVPVVDAARLLGATEAETPARFVLLSLGERRAVLAVESVVGVTSFSTAAAESLPPLLSESGADVVDALGRLDAALLVVLRGGHLVPDAAWAALAAHEGAA